MSKCPYEDEWKGSRTTDSGEIDKRFPRGDARSAARIVRDENNKNNKKNKK